MSTSALHGEVNREEVGVLFSAPDNFVGKEFKRKSFDSSLLLRQVNECLCYGGAYSLADSLQTLETHTGILRLDFPDRRERLIDAISTIQEVDESDPTYLLTRFDFLTELLVLVLDIPSSDPSLKPNMKAAEEIFVLASELRKSSLDFAPTTENNSHVRDLCSRLSKRLNSMQFGPKETDWVADLYRRLRLSYQGDDDYKGNRFARIYLTGGYTHRS